MAGCARILAVAAFATLAHAQAPAETVTVRGQVAGAPALSGDQAYLSINGSDGAAVLLEAPEFMFEKIAAGDRLEVRGVLDERGRQPVLRPVQITTLSHEPPPALARRRVEQLRNASAAGAVAVVEGRVTAIGEDGSGRYVAIDDGQPVAYPLYLSRRRDPAGTGLGRFHVGDRIRATGIAIASAGEYRMILADAESVALLRRGWPVAPGTIIGLILASGLFATWRWWRYRQTQMRHRTIRRLNAVSEDLVTAASAEEICRKVGPLPAALGLSTARLFRFDRTQNRLETMDDSAAPAIESAAAGLAFHNRTPLLISDARRTGLIPKTKAGKGGLIVLPVQARDELVGVLCVAHPHPIRMPSPEELAALQHAGNQAALALKLIESSQRKEQLLRSEKLAAAGQLIQGVTGELRAPLDSIVMAASRLMDQGTRDARAIVNESLRASAILSRLNMVARDDERGGSEPLDLNPCVAAAVQACRSDWEEMDLALDLQLAPKPLWVLGSPRQLGQVIRNLVSLAASSAVETRAPGVKISCGSMARRVTVTIEYAAPAELASRGEEDSGVLGFEVCRGIIQGNGGELKLTGIGGDQCRLEIGMPEAFPASAPAERKRLDRALTALLLEPDVAVQRRLVSLWTAQGHRAMPVANEAEGIELANRIKIDALFCAVRVGATNWVEIFEHTRERVAAFVLLTEGMESEESSLFPEGEGLVLRKPVDAGDVARLLERIEERAEAGVTGGAVRT